MTFFEVYRNIDIYLAPIHRLMAFYGIYLLTRIWWRIRTNSELITIINDLSDGRMLNKAIEEHRAVSSTDPSVNLVKADALIAVEINRLDRIDAEISRQVAIELTRASDDGMPTK